MRDLRKTTPFRAVLSLGLLLGLSACDDGEDMDADDAADHADHGQDDGMDSACSAEDRADDFAAGLAKDGAVYRVTIQQAEPADPIRGDNAWTLMVTDLAGAPVEGVLVDAKPWMPDHGHGTPVEEEVIELGDGMYEVSPLNLFMAGFWEVNLELTPSEGEMDEVMVGVCVE